MAKSLQGAYIELASTLRPQKQGTCGLYSFWFATLLLNRIDQGLEVKKPRSVVYPRKSEDPSQSRDPKTGEYGPSGGSMRSFSKTLGSGQGEVFTCAEMEQIVTKFDYSFESHVGEAGRDKFIEKSLAVNRPVLFPYMMGSVGPISSLPPKSKPGVDYGPHWSLIIDSGNDLYAYVEPNSPTKFVTALKINVLASNSFSDAYRYDSYWDKKTFSSQSTMPTVSKKKDGKTVWYDIGAKDRQTLANVLIAVF